MAPEAKVVLAHWNGCGHCTSAPSMADMATAFFNLRELAEGRRPKGCEVRLTPAERALVHRVNVTSWEASDDKAKPREFEEAADAGFPFMFASGNGESRTYIGGPEKRNFLDDVYRERFGFGWSQSLRRKFACMIEGESDAHVQALCLEL